MQRLLAMGLQRNIEDKVKDESLQSREEAYITLRTILKDEELTYRYLEEEKDWL